MRYRHVSQRAFDYAQTDQRVRAGLVGHWVGDGAGLTLRDRSGYRNNGTLISGGSWILGAGGKRNALELDGTDDYVDCGNAVSLQLSTQGTVAVWVKTTDADAYPSGIIIKEYNYGIFARGGTLQYYDWGGSGWNDSGVSITSGSWVHLAYSWADGVTGGSALYVNGLLVYTNITTLVGGGPPFDSLRLGTNSGDHPSQAFAGSLDDARVYDRILSPAQIALLAAPSFLPVISRSRRRVNSVAAPAGAGHRFYFAA